MAKVDNHYAGPIDEEMTPFHELHQSILNKKPAPALVPVAPSAVSPGQKKPRAHLLSSDDEVQVVKRPHDEAFIVEGKGKGRMPQSPRKQETAIVISSDGEDDEVVVVRVTKRHRSSSSQKDVKLVLDDVEIVASGSKMVKFEDPPQRQPTPEAGSAPLTADSTEDQFNAALASIVAIVPDVLPSYVLDLLHQPLYSGKIEIVVEHLFSERYPKIEVGGPSKVEVKAPEPAVMDWLDSAKRPHIVDPAYNELALQSLSDHFSNVPKPFIRNCLIKARGFYAPSWMTLEEALIMPLASRPFKILSKGRTTGKGKVAELKSDAFNEEKRWLRAKLAVDEVERKRVKAREALEQAEADAGLLLECGCCYTDFCFDVMIQCEEGHLFCKECCIGGANEQIGQRNFVLPCMSGSSCVFPESEYRRFLPETSIAVLHKIRMEKEIDLAGLEGLVKCPFCPYACVIENAEERLFRCERAGCEIVSCRQCQKADHLPRTCKEVSEDVLVDARHTVEEAMSMALLRSCPQCLNPYIKESGCNKMSCPNCGTLSCYLCSKIVKGYEHFTGAGSNASRTDPGACCPLWDRPGEREHIAIEAARAEAAALVGNHLDVDDLKLAPPPPPPANLAHLPIYNHLANHYDNGVLAAAARIERARDEPNRLRREVERLAAQARMAEQNLRFQRAEVARMLLVEKDRRAAAVQREAARAIAQEKRLAMENSRAEKRDRFLKRK